MGVLYTQASFKNSRIKTRPPTSEATTFVVTIPNGQHKGIDADITRTYITIRNLSLADSIKYDYASVGDTPNWADDAMTLKPGEAADLESPQEIWFENTSGAPMDIAVDEGKG